MVEQLPSGAPRGAIQEHSDRGAHALGEERENACVEAVCLGELSGGTRKVPDLARIGDDYRKSRCSQGTYGRHLEATCCLEDDQAAVSASHIRDERLYARFIAARPECTASGQSFERYKTLILDPVTKGARLLQHRAYEAGLVWQALFTRDGDALVVLANDTLAWIDVTAGTERSLGLNTQVLLGWSTDERALFFHAVHGAETGNWSVALSQGVPLVEPLLLQRTSPGVWWAGRGPDGVYYLEPVETPRLFLAEIDVAAARLNSAPQPILPAPGHVAGNPIWSRDGSRLAYTLRIPNRTGSRVFVADGLRGVSREIAALDLRVTGLTGRPTAGSSLSAVGH